MHDAFGLRGPVRILIALMLCAGVQAARSAEPGETPPSATHIVGGALPDVPGAPEGAFSGEIDGHAVLAGGLRAGIAHDAAPGEEDFLRAVFVLPAETNAWQRFDLDLPLAYGASAPVDGGLACLGGLAPDGASTGAYVVRLRIDDDGLVVGVHMDALDPMPQPRVFASAAVLDGALQVIGGSPTYPALSPAGAMLRHPAPDRPVDPDAAKKFNFMNWMRGMFDAVGALFVSGKTVTTAAHDEVAWREQPVAWNATLLRPAVGVRRDEIAIANALLVSGGWELQADDALVPTRTAWKYLADAPQPWTSIADVPEPYALLGASPVGPAHLLHLACRTDSLPHARAAFVQSGDDFLNYHMFTDTWIPVPVRELAPAGRMIPHGEGFVLLDDTPDAAGTLRADLAELEYHRRDFSTLDYAMLVLYIGGLIWIGTYFSKREKGTEDFFLGGRRIPWWAAGLSIYATGVSAISFMAIPAKTYATNWLYLCMGIFPIFSTYIAAYAFVPLLRRLNLTTVMEYKDLRFGKTVRTISSFLMVFAQVGGRMSITLLLPSIALAAVTGFDLFWCIIFMGVLSTVYTIMGGISAVIWTDVLQVFVLFGGAILSFFLVLGGIEGGFGQMIEVGRTFGKFQAFDWSFDFTVATVWVMALWGVSDIFGRLGQEGMQRAFSTEGEKAARRSMITCAIVSIPGTIIFFSLGSALFAYYHGHPGQLDPTLKTDGIFPLFIAQQLPAGVAGLVIAGLFAAAMSTLDSAMNSVSTVIVRDWFAVFHRDTSDRDQLSVARWITFVCGVLGTGMACFLGAQKNLGSLWDTFSIIMALVGGGFGAVYALGLLTTRANEKGVVIGALLNTVLLIWLKLYTEIHFFIYGTICLVTGFVLGYLLSLILPDRQPRDLTGLTLWTLRRPTE